MASLILITGGARSGKSRFAESLLAAEPLVTYIATAEALDEEMKARIAEHRGRRPEYWQTLESPLNLGTAVQQAAGRWILIDCLAVWVANLLLTGWDEQADHWAAEVSPKETVLTAVRGLLQVITAQPGQVVAVTNEVGSGLVPSYRLGRLYRDLLGLANQEMAAAAEQVFCCISGIPFCLKGGK